MGGENRNHSSGACEGRGYVIDKASQPGYVYRLRSKKVSSVPLPDPEKWDKTKPSWKSPQGSGSGYGCVSAVEESLG